MPQALRHVPQDPRIWAKVLLLAVVLVYFLLFLYFNSQDVVLWLFPGTQFQTNMVVALLGAVVLGSLLTLLVRMVAVTLRQVRQRRDRVRTDKLEREITDMRTKAASLKTRE